MSGFFILINIIFRKFNINPFCNATDTVNLLFIESLARLQWLYGDAE
ncbi:MAG: hypothetical protein PWQ06_458 [Anaerophaga sp.]|nr:hypothetical protein [Anaerophaga sp.]